MDPENLPKVTVTKATGSIVVAGVLRYPGFDVDVDRGELRVAGRVVALRPKTFALLTYLALPSQDRRCSVVVPRRNMAQILSFA
jgi:hypothetical protein